MIADTSLFSSVFLAVNANFCSMFGFAPDEFQNRTLSIIMGKSTDTQKIQSLWSHVLIGHERSCNCTLCDKSGLEQTVLVQFSPRSLCKEVNGHAITIVAVRIFPMQLLHPKKVIDRLSRRENCTEVRTTLNVFDGLSEMMDLVEIDLPFPNNSMERICRTVDIAFIQSDQNKHGKSNLCESFLGTNAEQGARTGNNIPPAVDQPDIARILLSKGKSKSIAADESIVDLQTPTIESRRASRALHNAFPRSIAEAIIEGRRPEPVLKECVSVFFSDIVGFTELSSRLGPDEVSSLLTRLFAKFDALAQLHGVQKVDVIGDAYLAAANLLEDQRGDHAARVARFARDAAAAAAATRLDDTDPSSPAVQIRIGIHCGPASAVVVGAQGLKFTVVGDTVNTASRMESTSLPGRIQCSPAAAALIALQDPFVSLAARGEPVDVKGKGRMHTYWVAWPAARQYPVTAAADLGDGAASSAGQLSRGSSSGSVSSDGSKAAGRRRKAGAAAAAGTRWCDGRGGGAGRSVSQPAGGGGTASVAMWFLRGPRLVAL